MLPCGSHLVRACRGNIRRSFLIYRWASTNIVETDKTSDNIAVLSLNNKPVNSLTQHLMQDVTKLIREFEENKDIKGVILTSNVKSIFSAGLDLSILYNANEDEIREYWKTFQDFWFSIYASKVVTTAAVSGHALAGGAVLACSTDYRVMVGSQPFTFGFNESKFGLPLPSWAVRSIAPIMGYRRAEIELMKGTTFNATDAMEVGLVDELAESKEEALEKCKKFIEDMWKAEKSAVIMTKERLREPSIEYFERIRESDLELTTKFLMSSEMKNKIGSYLQSLKKK